MRIVKMSKLSDQMQRALPLHGTPQNALNFDQVCQSPSLTPHVVSLFLLLNH